jgi:hypothetical protein
MGDWGPGKGARRLIREKHAALELWAEQVSTITSRPVGARQWRAYSIPTLAVVRQSRCSPHPPRPANPKDPGSRAPSEGAEGAAQSWVRRRRRPTELLGGQMPASLITLRMTFASALFGQKAPNQSPRR